MALEGPDEVREVRALAERLRSAWSGEPRSLSLVKPYDFHKQRHASWDEFVAFEMGWGVWWCLPAFGFASGVIGLMFDGALPVHEAPVVRQSEGAGNVQCSHIRHYLKRSYLDDHLHPRFRNAWLKTRADWAERRRGLVPIHQALGNTDTLEDMEAVVYDDALLPPEGEMPPERPGQVLSRLDPSSYAARLGPIARAVREGGEPDLDADVGPWRPLVASMTVDEEVYSPRQAAALLQYPGNVDISGQSIYVVRFPNRNNAQYGIAKVGLALKKGAEQGHFTPDQQRHPMFRAYVDVGSTRFQAAAAELSAAGDHHGAWNALVTANLYVPQNQKARTWVPLFKKALGVARAGNFRFVPVLEWMWANYVEHNPDVDPSGV